MDLSARGRAADMVAWALATGFALDRLVKLAAVTLFFRRQTADGRR